MDSEVEYEVAVVLFGDDDAASGEIVLEEVAENCTSQTCFVVVEGSVVVESAVTKVV